MLSVGCVGSGGLASWGFVKHREELRIDEKGFGRVILLGLSADHRCHYRATARYSRNYKSAQMAPLVNRAGGRRIPATDARKVAHKKSCFGFESREFSFVVDHCGMRLAGPL